MGPKTELQRLREREEDGEWEYEQYDPDDDLEWLYADDC